jgi:hypothetical protein
MKKGVVGILVLLGLVVAIVLTSRETRSSRPSVVGSAHVRFLAWNVGSVAARVSILPILNDSVMALSTGSVPAHSLRHLWAQFGDEAPKRDLLECTIQIDAGHGLGRPVPLSVAPPD